LTWLKNEGLQWMICLTISNSWIEYTSFSFPVIYLNVLSYN
jgi:hypothetical protein